MDKEIYGTAAVILGDNIDTDQIYPGRFLELVKPEEIGKYCLAGVDERIAPCFPHGGIVVAGRNFGCGSSREHAPIALLNMGAAAVVADSFARIFFRNAINLGLPLIICKGISSYVEQGDRLCLELSDGVVSVPNKRLRFQGEPAGEVPMRILQAGGIKEFIRSGMSLNELSRSEDETI